MAEADDAEAVVRLTVTPAAAKAVSTMEAADDLRLPLTCGEFADADVAAFRNFVKRLEVFDFLVFCVRLKL